MRWRAWCARSPVGRSCQNCRSPALARRVVMEDRPGGMSDLGRWLCRATSAASLRKAIAGRCAELIAGLDDPRPPTRTGPLGQLLGLEPAPRLRAQIPRGMLDL